MMKRGEMEETTHRSLSPIHLGITSLLEILNSVESTSVAMAFARKLFPVPGGPYNNIPLFAFLSPVNSCGNLIGKITASCRSSLAASRPATSSPFHIWYFGNDGGY
jgi:hypothetical protein